MIFLDKTKLSIITASLLLGMSINAFGASVTITNNGTLASTSLTGFAAGQSFIATKTGVLTSIGVAHDDTNGATGSCTLTIYSGAGTGGTALHTQSVTLVGTDDVLALNNYTFRTITLNSTINLTSGSPYTFAFSPATCHDLGYVNNTYANGDLYVDGALTNTNDLAFEVVQGDPANTAPTLGGTFTTAGTVDDNATTTPFSGVTVGDTDSNPVSVAITYIGANGTLTGTGITGTAGSYSMTSAALATVQANLQGLVFHPTANQVAPASTVVTTFTLTPNDGTINGTANSTTVVTATSVNDTPTDITLSSSSVNQSSGANAVVGTLSNTDVDTGQTYTYTLVAGTGDTNNTSFNISTTSLRANNASVLAAGTYAVRLDVNDSIANFEKAFTITVVDNVVPTLTAVTAASNNTNTTKAKVGDVITLTFTASEALAALPTATISGQTATVASTGGNSYTATRTMLTGDAEGTAFSIDFSDVATNAGTQVTGVTSGSLVTFDKTAPTGYAVSFTTSPINSTNKTAVAFAFTGAEVGTTYNYSIDDTNATTTAVTGTGTIATTTDSISGIDLSGLDDGNLTLSVTLTDPTGNVGTTVTNTVTKDATLPVVTEVTPVTSPTAINTPSYTFNTTESGTLTVGGSCGTSTNTAVTAGNVSIILTQTNNTTALADGTYANCTITVTDASGNASATLNIPSFTVDATAPTAATFAPANAANHPKNNNLTITFNEAVRNIDNSEITNANIASLITLKLTNSVGADVPFSATIDVNKKIITVNPTADLTEAQVYYLAYANVEDLVGNLRASENITFTAAPDTIAPTATSFFPVDNNTTTAIDTNLSVVFNENIQVGAGNITLAYDTNDSVFEVLDINTSNRISISNNILTIDPTNNLDFNTTYYLYINNGAIKDVASTPNAYVGISVKTDWNFTTFAKLSLTNLEGANIAYTEGDGNVSLSSLITVVNPSDENITNAKVAISSGFVTSEDVLHFTSQNGITGSFNTTSGVLDLSGTTTIANYQTALRSITYQNTNNSNPSTTNRVLDINITDSKATSLNVQRTIAITAIANTPNAFSFTAKTSQALSTLIESELVKITGIGTNIPISITGGEYKIGVGAWVSTAGTINNDENVTLRQTSSASYSTTTTINLTVGDTTANFSVATLAAPYVAPAPVPTEAPTIAPTEAPTEAPTIAPTEAPTEAPTIAPTEAPTEAPTIAPTEAPTEAPTIAPTEAPTIAPTEAPTEAPTIAPTEAPTEAPTIAPTEAPTEAPTIAPTEAPTEAPTSEIPLQSPTQISIIVVDTTQSAIKDQVQKHVIIINEVATGLTLGAVDATKTDSATGVKTTTLNLVDTAGEKRTVGVQTNTAPIVTTNIDGVQLKTINDLADGTHTDDSTQIFTNGTTQTTAKVTTLGGVTKTNIVQSLRVDSQTSVQDDGSVTSTSNVDNSEVTGSTTKEGQTIHKVSKIDSLTGKRITTQARSKINNSVITIRENGIIQTNAQLLNAAGENVATVVEASSDGTSKQVLQITKKDGSVIVSEVRSGLVGAQTVIEENGNVNTNIQVNDTTTIKANLRADGTVKNSIKGLKTTTVEPNIKGSSVNVTKNGSMETKSEVSRDGFTYQAVVTSDKDGKTETKFIKTNIATGEQSNISNTLTDKTPYDAGNSVEISDINGKIFIKTTAPLTDNLVVDKDN